MIRDEKTGVVYVTWPCASGRAVFLCVHGLGAYSGRWASAGEWFQQRGFVCYAVDLRGFGRTSGRKGHVDSFSAYVNDILSLREIISRQHGSAKVFLVGDSMGALICFMAAGLKPELFAGLICLAPAFRGRLRFSRWTMAMISLCLMFHPRKQFQLPFTSAMCTRDPYWQKALDCDPCEHRLATPRLLFGILRAQQQADALAGKIELPVLFLNAGDDDALVDPAAAGRIFRKLKTHDKELIQYPEMRHALCVDTGREKVFEDIKNWVYKRL